MAKCREAALQKEKEHVRTKDRSMKIAVIGHKRVPSREGGIEKTVEKQMLGMLGRGHEIVFYNRSGHNIFGAEFDFEAHIDREGLRIEKVPTPRGPVGVVVYSFLATVKALCRKCDILYYHGSGPCVMIPLAKLFGAKCVGMLHGIDSKRSKWNRIGKAFLGLGERFAAKSADACFVLSKHNEDYIRKVYGKETIRIFNGAERPEEVPDEVYTELARRFGIARNEYILTLVRIVPEKGIHYLIRAFKSLDTDMKLVIAGGVDPACHDYEEKLRALADHDPRIIFTGYVEEPYVTALYKGSHLFVLPSDLEGMAHSLLEAMAAGCCCITSDIPENRAVLDGCGETFCRGNAKDLAKKMKMLLADPDLADEYRETAPVRVLRKYSWKDCVDIVEQVFESIAEKA